jgi:hypothetical protein
VQEGEEFPLVAPHEGRECPGVVMLADPAEELLVGRTRGTIVNPNCVNPNCVNPMYCGCLGGGPPGCRNFEAHGVPKRSPPAECSLGRDWLRCGQLPPAGRRINSPHHRRRLQKLHAPRPPAALC